MDLSNYLSRADPFTVSWEQALPGIPYVSRAGILEEPVGTSGRIALDIRGF